MFWPFKRKSTGQGAVEHRASGYTAQVMQARSDYITGARGVAELTATAQGAVSLWEHGLSVADVTGTDMLAHQVLGIAGRSLALRGEAPFLIRDSGLVPVAEYDRHGSAGASGGPRSAVLAALPLLLEEATSAQEQLEWSQEEATMTHERIWRISGFRPWLALYTTLASVK